MHATTALAVATDYGKYARNKSISAWVNDIVATFIGLVGVAAIVYHLIFNSQGNSDVIGVSFTRFAVSVAALGLAALIGRRASQHHREARREADRTGVATRWPVHGSSAQRRAARDNPRTHRARFHPGRSGRREFCTG